MPNEAQSRLQPFLNISRVFPVSKVCKSQVARDGSGEVSKGRDPSALKVAHYFATAMSQKPVSIYEGSAHFSLPIRGRRKLTLVA
jgi:hypothetical protein